MGQACEIRSNRPSPKMRALLWLTAITMAVQRPGCDGVSVLRAAVEPIAETASAADAHSCMCAHAACADTGAAGSALNFLDDPQCASSCIEEQRCCGDFFEACAPPVGQAVGHLELSVLNLSVVIIGLGFDNALANTSGPLNALADPSPQRIVVTVDAAVSGTFDAPGQLEFELMQHGTMTCPSFWARSSRIMRALPRCTRRVMCSTW